ncbi:MAG: PaaI family thioesterase [Chloroflexi bacterium]|nr:PaaI family thioesterase [Chloroflexota bacterium]
MDDRELQAMCDESPVHRLLGLVAQRTPDGVDISAQLDSRFGVDRAASFAHGGIVASLLDTAASFALIARSGHDWTTVDLRVDYLRPTPLDVVSVRGEVVRAGRSIGRARSALHDTAGNLCATAIGTFVPSAGT